MPLQNVIDAVCSIKKLEFAYRPYSNFKQRQSNIGVKIIDSIFIETATPILYDMWDWIHGTDIISIKIFNAK